MNHIRIVRADITTLDVDSVVNAANETLLGGGGVDGAIHLAAGPELLKACRALGGCEPGQAKITPGFALLARWVIHTVGPRWRGGGSGEEDVLRSCYRNSIALASEHGLATIAFPSISTGAFGYPLTHAAPVALEEITRGVTQFPNLSVTVVCFETEVLRAYRRIVP
jgi:O-acetyl-ADP-ribose deacetylase (regulator of RNase III)